MAKKVVGYIKLQVKAGQANPSPPVGPALGQRGLNIMEFCKAFNAATPEGRAGSADSGDHHRVFATAPSPSSPRRRRRSILLKKAAGIEIGQQAPEHREGRQGHAQAARGNRQGEGSRPDCSRPGRGGADDCGLRPQHGSDGGGLKTMTNQATAKRSQPSRRAGQGVPSRRSAEGSSRTTARRSSSKLSTSLCSLGVGRREVRPASARFDACCRSRLPAKSVRVAVFAPAGAKADEALAAGAEAVGMDDLAEKNAGRRPSTTTSSSLPRTRCAWSASSASVLGPRGLMPNPKVGTVSPNPAEAVKNAKAGQVRYQHRQGQHHPLHDRQGQLRSTQSLKHNLHALLLDLIKAKPSTRARARTCRRSR